jgi:hypothetical protein
VRGRLPAPAAAFVTALLAAAAAAAQSARIEVSPAPHYAGEPIEIHISAHGFAEEPVPEVEVAQPPRGRLVAAGVQPNVSTSIVIVGGKMRQTKEVTFVFSYRLRVDQPGPLTVGPFVLTQAGATATTRAVPLKLGAVPTDDRLDVTLELPDAPVYLGERVPVTIRFRLEGGLRKNLVEYALRVPLFDLTDAFQFLDPPELAGGTEVEIATEAGVLQLKGQAEEAGRGAEKDIVVTLQRIAVPLREGALEIPPTRLDVEEGVRYRRDLFGGRRATHVRKWRARDVPRRLVVKRIPSARTPASFAGAVGSGFSLAVAADRTVVQVGEPISLSFELRGEGNLETAALPPLDADGLLPASQFRVPEGALAGRLEAGAKRFTAVVRVLDPSVREIPALEYAWFDPTSEEFQTTRSRPIALSVRDAEVIGAADVQRDTPRDEPRDSGATAGARPAPGEVPLRRGPLRLTGADLAIERDLARLLRRDANGAQRSWLIAGLYAGALVVLGLAQLDRRRRAVDPALRARRRQVDAELRRIRRAAALPTREAVAELARALRRILAELPDARAPEIDEFLGECDARSYAPAGRHDGASLEPGFHRRAMALAERMAGEGR